MKKLLVGTLVVLALALIAGSGAVWAAAGNAAAATPAAATPQAATDQAWIGVAVADLNARLAKALNITATEGVVVTMVTANGPAAAAGVKKGDVLTEVNGTAVKTAQDVVNLVQTNKSSDVVTLAVMRGAEKLSIKVTAQAAPTSTRPSILDKLRNGPTDRATPSPSLPSELNPLKDVPADQRFSHNYGTTRTYTDKDGKVVTIYTIPGVVTAISPTSITIKPNNPESKGGPFSIDGATRIMAGKIGAGTEAIAVGDQVTVTVVGDSSHATLITKAVAAGNLREFLKSQGNDKLQRILPNLPKGIAPNGTLPNGGMRGGRNFKAPAPGTTAPGNGA